MLMAPAFETLGSGQNLSKLSLNLQDDLSNLSADQSILPGSQLASLSFTMDSQALIGRPSFRELGLEGFLEVENDEGLGFAFDANGEIFEEPVMKRTRTPPLEGSISKRQVEATDHTNLEHASSGSPAKRARSDLSNHSNFDGGLPQVGLFHGLDELSPIRPTTQHTESCLRNVELDLDFVEERPVMAQAAAKARKRKARVLTLDSAIELSSSALKDWQSSYLVTMKKQKLIRISKQEKEITNENGKLYTWAYEGRVEHPLLKEIFCRRLPGALAPQREPAMHDPDIMTNIQGPPFESEVAVGQDLMNSEVELGRRAGTEEREFLSGQNSLLPWNVSREESQARSVSGAGLSANSLLNTPRQFSFMQTPILRSRQASLRPGSRASGVIGMGGLERVDSQEVMEDLEQRGVVVKDPAISTQLANDSQYILQSMQQESLNFLEYTRTKLAQSTKGRAEKSTISFSVVVPPQETTAFVAAQVSS